MPTLDFTINKHPNLSLGNAPGAHGKYTGPASYLTGGDAFDAQDLKLGAVSLILFEPAPNGSGAIRHLVYDVANAKVIWFDTADPHAQIANGTDLSAFSARFFAIGS